MTMELQTKRGHTIKRIVVLSWLVLAMVYAAGNQAYAVLAEDALQPITLEATVTLQGEQDGGFWLAGFAAEPDATPDVLGVAWVPVPAGWFGDVWTLQLAGSADMLAPRSTEDGTGILDGLQTVRITTETPQPGHAYRIVVSYDPRNGSFGTRIFDETDDELLAEYAEQLATFDGVLYGQAGYHLSDHSGEVIALEQAEQFVPIGLTWRLVTVDEQQFMRPVQTVDRRDEVYAHTRQPWDEGVGALRLTIQDETGVLETVTMQPVENNGLLALPLSHMPAGDYVVAAEYVTGDEHVDLGEVDVQLGVLFHEFADVRVRLDADDDIHVVGEVAVWADGPVHDAAVAVNAYLDRLVLQPEQYANRHTLQPVEEVNVRILDHHVEYIDEDRVYIPFTAALTPQSETAWPYRMWNVRLEPETATVAALQYMPYEQSVRIYTEEQPERADNTVRVMTYNIQHGRGMDDVLDLQRIADVIAYADVDVVGLQEVDVRTTRSSGVDQAQQIAEYLDMEFVFGGNIPYRGGQYGNAILSRYPIESWQNELLPLTEDEARGLLHAVVDTNGTEFTFFTTHLSLHKEENALQREAIADRLAEVIGSFVVVGDFNVQVDDIDKATQMIGSKTRDAWREAIDISPLGDDLRRIGRLGNTFSSAKPDRRIDYIFLSPEVTLDNERSIFIIDTLASDHVPIVAEVTIREDQQ